MNRSFLVSLVLASCSTYAQQSLMAGSFHDEFIAFSRMPDLYHFTCGMNSADGFSEANEIYDELVRNVENISPKKIGTYSEDDVGVEQMVFLHDNAGDYESSKYLLSKSILGLTKSNKDKPEASMTSLGMRYLYGYNGFEKNINKARVILGFAASKGYRPTKVAIANDYVFQNPYADQGELFCANFLMNKRSYDRTYIKAQRNLMHRLNYFENDGYAVMIQCRANNSSKKIIDIDQCLDVYQPILSVKGDHGYSIGYSIMSSDSVMWRDLQGMNIFYTPNKFSINVSNGANNTILHVSVLHMESQASEEYEAQSYESINVVK